MELVGTKTSAEEAALELTLGARVVEGLGVGSEGTPAFFTIRRVGSGGGGLGLGAAGNLLNDMSVTARHYRSPGPQEV